MEFFSDPQVWIAFGTLTLLELVLGIDNVIFISILSGKLPPEQRAKARYIGLGLALGIRILLLLSLSWVIGLVEPLFTVWGRGFSGKDLVLLIGGLFLIAKSTHEIHGSLEGEEGHGSKKAYAGFVGVIIQIVLLDIVFSLDSVITAVGMISTTYGSNGIYIMVSAVVISIIAMMLFAGSIGAFVQKHPTIKMLALSFLLLIGVMLVAEGFHQTIPKGYIYFAMAFSVLVEFLNMRLRKKAEPVHLHNPYTDEDEQKALAES
ncbi:MAG: TerC family protein [Pyrinomonadaceae bacterium]|jgi:predicted tellurium resistance membrane protein TerC|nr:TerC family protein [Acidobacteriota bacterium]MBP7475416.1 TerC family protein [Pyrinomonadaceae bacterium]MBP9108520.1 TerC family protein [Pyrinomonadaceae bacterium]